MILPRISVGLVVSLLMCSGAAFAEGDPERGRSLAETCMGCHAVKGYYNVYPSYRVPKLGGQNAKYVESALKAYKTGERNHGTMQANADNLSDQDMADIGAFLEGHGK
jgi:cytochrome c553